jgi:hypothetical protein
LSLRPLVGDSFSLTRPDGLANDFAGLLGPAGEERVQALVQEVRAESKGEIAVVTPAHLTISQVASASPWNIRSEPSVGHSWAV